MGEAVALPHTWNAVDGQDGGNDYYRGTCWYTLALKKPTIPAGGKAVLQLDGAAMTAAVYLNGEKLAEHKGGYSTFRVDLTDHLQEENLLAISVDNSDNDTVYPQKADFTFYGGIYRDVTLHIVPAEYFALSDNGTPALKVTPIVTDLAAKTAEVTVEAAVVGAQSVTFALEGQTITAPVEKGTATAVFTLDNAHLWDGIDDPFLYLKLTRHNGRAGTHGTYNPKHNDRSFNLANSEHIDSERAKGNIYWDCFHGFRSTIAPQDPDELAATFSDVERQFYETHYTAFVESQNERNAKIRHTERNRSIPDLLSSRKTCPEETIYQLGTLDEHASAEDLISHLYRPALGRSHDDLQQRRLQVGVQPCHAGNAASPSAGLYAGGCTGWHDLRLSGGLHG